MITSLLHSMVHKENVFLAIGKAILIYFAGIGFSALSMGLGKNE